MATLIAAHEPWERAADRRLREPAILFDLVTIVTVAFGILALYHTASSGRSLLIGNFTLPIDMERIRVQNPAQPVLCRKGGSKPRDSLFDVLG